jgi:hypothetical protein
VEKLPWHRDKMSVNGNNGKKTAITVFSGGMEMGSSPAMSKIKRIYMDTCMGPISYAPSLVTNVWTGTGASGLVDMFNKIIERRKCKLQYIIPISDNGGSSSEIIRFVGGPSKSRQPLLRFQGKLTSETGVGDIRST